MSTQFEDWAGAEIKRLRTEADALERALGKYREEQRLNRMHAVVQSEPRHVSKPTGRRPQRGSKNQFILAKIREAGSSGLNTQQVAEAIAAAGISIKRSSVRSLLYYNVKEGKLVRTGDQYILAAERPSA